MGGMMKNETDVLTLQIKGDGPLGGITVTADAKGDVKGYVDHPEAMMPPKNGKLDVGGAVGIGLLNVIKDMGLTYTGADAGAGTGWPECGIYRYNGYTV